MVRMTKRAQKTITRSTEEWMVDVLELWRPSTSNLDEDTLVEENVEGDFVWTGKGRISPTRGPQEQAVGEGVLALRDVDFLIPVDAPIPWRDDEVKCVASNDPELVGRWFKVTDVRVFSQQAARRFSGIQAQPSRLWNLNQTTEVENGG